MTEERKAPPWAGQRRDESGGGRRETRPRLSPKGGGGENDTPERATPPAGEKLRQRQPIPSISGGLEPNSKG